MPVKQPCEEKQALLIEYQKATARYSAAVKHLSARIGVISRAEYDELHRSTERARHASGDALDRLDRHRADHDC